MESRLFQYLVEYSKIMNSRKRNVVFLRPLAVCDLERSRRWVNDRALWPLILRNSVVSRKNQAQWYHDILTSKQKKVFAIVIRQGCRHVGNAGFYEISREHRRAKFWIFLGERKTRGKGYGAEATAQMIRYGFDKLGLEKIFLEVAVSNSCARALYSRFGFSCEGVLKHHYRIGRRWFDVEIMALLRR